MTVILKLTETIRDSKGIKKFRIAHTGLVKIMLTLKDYFSPADRRTPWVTD